MVDPDARALEIVTGGYVRRTLTDTEVELTALQMQSDPSPRATSWAASSAASRCSPSTPARRTPCTRADPPRAAVGWLAAAVPAGSPAAWSGGVAGAAPTRRRSGLRVLLLRGERRGDVGPALAHVALGRGVGRRGRPATRRPGRGAPGWPSGLGKMYSSAVEAAGCPCPPRSCRRRRGTLSTYGASTSSWPECWNARRRCAGSRWGRRRGPRRPPPRPWPRRWGRAARAAAACSWPEIVLSRSSSASIRVGRRVPAAPAPVSSVQRRSVSTARPSKVRTPSSRPSRSSSACVAAGGAGVRPGEGQLVVAARLGVRRSAAQACSHVARRASRFCGAL